MPRFLFLAVQAWPVYPSHAAWLLQGSVSGESWQWITVETAIRDSPAAVLERVLPNDPDVLGATFTLFNREWLATFLARFRAVNPRTIVIGGGPELLGDSRGFFEPIPLVHLGIRGEGERALRQWLTVWNRPERWGEIPGVIWRDAEGRIHDDGREAERPEEAEIVSPYLRELQEKRPPFVFLETVRGCSGACLFCTSASRGGTRYFSLERIADEVDAIRNAGVNEVRLLDRTFNEKEDRACAILALLRDRHPQARVHLEIDPSLMTPALAETMKTFAVGQLHVEAGVQTLEPKARAASGRRGSVEAVWEGLTLLRQAGSPILHLDLLAGLPEQTWEGLLSDLSAIVRWGPEAIQLEVVKVLPGTLLARQAARRGIRYSPFPPYEVLATPTFSYADLRRAARLSRLVDGYYNERSLRPVMQRISREDPDFWAVFESVVIFPEMGREGLTLERRYTLLAEWLERHRPSLLADLVDAWYRREPVIHPRLGRARVRSPRLPEGRVLEGGCDEGPYWRVIEVEAPLKRWYAWQMEKGGHRRLVAVFRPESQ